jgi:ATP-dependent Lon protease
MAAKKTNTQLAKARKQWDAEAHEMQGRIDEHVRARNAAEQKAMALSEQLTKTRDELAKQTALAAHSVGEAEGLRLAMRMLANTIIGKETFQSWPWQAPEAK